MKLGDNPSMRSFIYNVVTAKLEVFCTKGALKNFANFSGKHLCWSLFLIKLQALGLQLHYKETSTHVFSCEIYEISENAYFVEHL